MFVCFVPVHRKMANDENKKERKENGKLVLMFCVVVVFYLVLSVDSRVHLKHVCNAHSPTLQRKHLIRNQIIDHAML